MVDKKIDFYVNGVYYTFPSSLTDEFYPVDTDIVRVVDYTSAMKIYEDDTYYPFNALSQIDLKVSLIAYILIPLLDGCFSALA